MIIMQTDDKLELILINVSTIIFYIYPSMALLNKKTNHRENQKTELLSILTQEIHLKKHSVNFSLLRLGVADLGSPTVAHEITLTLTTI